jgi:hypothetical protein
MGYPELFARYARFQQGVRRFWRRTIAVLGNLREVLGYAGSVERVNLSTRTVQHLVVHRTGCAWHTCTSAYKPGATVARVLERRNPGIPITLSRQKTW